MTAGLETSRLSWRLSAGDERTVMDENNARLVSVPCGGMTGMTGRTFAEAAEIARLIAASPDLLEAFIGLEGILATAESNASGNPEWEAVSAKISAARAAIAKALGQ